MMFPSIRIEGTVLSADLIARLESGDLKGQRPADFGAASPAALKDDIVRAWTHSQAYWRAFSDRLQGLKENATGTTETRNLFLIPLLGLLGYSDLEFSRPELVGDKPFPISHRLMSHAGFAVHIVGVRESLDRRSTTVIGHRSSPHGMVQEYLNLTERLYALVTNGRVLRLLRNSTRLVKLSYVEFDLERMFGEELYADFAALYRLLHVTRLPKSPAFAAESLLEVYHQNTLESGARIREGLRTAVEHAIRELANGFLDRSPALQEAVRAGTLEPRDFYRSLLRLIYRLLFLMTAEERGLLFPRDAEPRKQHIYENHYSLARLRRLAERRHMVEPGKCDLWLGLCSTFRLFVEEGAGAPLGLTALCGHLFSPNSLGPLCDSTLDNVTLLSALAPLSIFRDRDTGQRVRVNYGALATEEFGSVYESLLELHPVMLDGSPPRFAFKQAAGNERKTTGSYYTPSSLVECLLDSALDPVVEQRLAGKKGADAEHAILSLNVCDPAVGSGHFLIAAGHRLARRLATIRAGDDEPSPDQLRHALREVIGNCLYGVDVNPMSVELCKVTLWLEATEPGKPLSFLDHHIQCGNSLLGATPRVLADGLPDDAFKPLTGDDKIVCAEAKKRNKGERQQLALFHGADTKPWERLGNLPAAMIEVETMSDSTAAGLHRKEQRYAELVRSTSYENARFLADAWCAAFVWQKNRDFSYPITNDVLRKIERNPHDCAPWMRVEIERLRDRYHFFHWQLAFPEVFLVPKKGERPADEQAGWNGGFDVVLGNPPWERVKLQEKEWFAERYPAIADAPNAAVRKRLIERLPQDNPTLYAEFTVAVRQAEGESHALRASTLYPLCGRGDINVYAIFAEKMRSLCRLSGRVGAILPSGIVTDDTTKLFFQNILENQSLASVFHFENEEKLFAGVHNAFRFVLITLGASHTATFVFYARQVEQIHDVTRQFTLSAEDFSLLNPNSRTCPTFRSAADAEISKRIYRHVPVFIRESSSPANPWNARFQTMFHMANDSILFRTATELCDAGWSPTGNRFVRDREVMLPLYEGKMLWQFDHRFGTYDGQTEAQANKGFLPQFNDVQHADPELRTQPGYWVNISEVERRLSDKWGRGWLLGWRDITGVEKGRTVVAAIFPRYAVSHTTPVLFSSRPASDIALLYSNLCAFALDYCARQKIGGTHLTYGYLEQFPVLLPATYVEPCSWAGKPIITLRDWLLPRVLELTYTAWDLEPFARDCGWFGPPFVWDEARRFQLRCEVDAAFFHLYGLSRADAAHVLDTFPIVRRKDEAAHGTYRTRDTILALYDELAECRRTATAFISPLSPPPADLRACHSPRALNSRVAEFSFAIPAVRRPRIHTTAELFIILLPALVQEGGGRLTYADLLAALTFLTETDPESLSLPPPAASTFLLWRGTFPTALADPNALQAALHDLIVMRHALNIRIEGDGYTLFPGIQWASIAHEWTLLDARLALTHAATAADTTPSWRGAVSDSDLYRWTTAA